LRTRGTDHLLGAARDCGVTRFVAQSYCGWPYARSGGAVKTETDPLDPTPPNELRRSLDAIRYLENAVTNATGIDGVVLRYGSFYGNDTGMFDAGFIREIRKRHVPLIGNGGAWWSFLHINDAAEATMAAIERGSGIYNIADDEPAPVRDWLPALAEMLGAKPPFHVPAWLARLLAGEHLVVMMTESRAGSNAKAKSELGWRPQHPSWRAGFAEIVRRKARLAA
jgi:nucleoside-diphosphate-sugar epimerase